jgi:hypothetical protein
MLFHRRREAARLEAELQFHLEQQVAENIASGMAPHDPRRAALLLFGIQPFCANRPGSHGPGTGLNT